MTSPATTIESVEEQPHVPRGAGGRFTADNPYAWKPGQSGNPAGGPNIRKPKVDPLTEQIPTTPAALNDWLQTAAGNRLPSKAVCPGHSSPLDAVWAIFSHSENEAVWLGSRGSGKTLALALLHIANCTLKAGFETAHYGGIQPQAKRCHRYVNGAIIAQPSLKQVVTDVLVTRITWRNGSELSIAPLTDRQSQSPHGALVSVDEVESAKPKPLERVRSVPIQYEQHPGQLILASTRVEAAGLMDKTLEDAKERGVPIYEWCWLEALQPCTIEPDSPLYPYVPAVLREDGKAVVIESDGWRLLADLEATHARVSEETWQVEYMNARPAAKALVYPVEPIVTEDAEYQPGAGPVIIGGDWGFTDLTAFVFAQLRGTELAVFDLLEGKGISERDWARKVIDRICRLPDYNGPDMEEWKRIWKEADWRAATWPSCWPEVACDPSAAQLRFELKEHGVTVHSPKKVKHNIVPGQNVLRGAIQRGLIFHPRVESLLIARSNYRTKQLPDGSYTATPDPDERNHKWSHGLDALRYMVWSIRRRLGLGAEPTTDDEDSEGEE